jgi:hypothetical protein
LGASRPDPEQRGEVARTPKRAAAPASAAETLVAIRASGATPLDYLIQVMRDESLELAIYQAQPAIFAVSRAGERTQVQVSLGLGLAEIIVNAFLRRPA